MTTKIALFLSFCILTISALSQINDTEKEVFKSWKQYSRGTGRVIRHTDSLPWTSYYYQANTKNLYLIKLIYPKKKSYDFYIVNDKLVQILIIDIPKIRYLNAYIFKDNSLISKHGDYKDSLDLQKLQEAFTKYKAKAMTEELAAK